MRLKGMIKRGIVADNLQSSRANYTPKKQRERRSSPSFTPKAQVDARALPNPSSRREADDAAQISANPHRQVSFKTTTTEKRTISTLALDSDSRQVRKLRRYSNQGVESVIPNLRSESHERHRIPAIRGRKKGKTSVKKPAGKNS